MGRRSEPTTGFLVWRLSTKWRAAVDRAVAPMGLTHAQYSLLASLAGLASTGARPSQRELAEFSGLDPIYVSKLARALERAGLVRRTGNPADPRAVQLALTEEGAEVVRAAVEAVGALQEELTAPIGGTRGDRNRRFVDTLKTLLGQPASGRAATDDGSESMTTAPPLTGQDINVAANATRALLDVQLDRAGLAFEQWVALRALTAPGPAERATVRGRLAELLSIPPATVDELLDGLAARGLVREDGTVDTAAVDLTPQGRAAFDQVNDGGLATAAKLYGDMDSGDLATTKRVLADITERARAMRDRI
jgi:DNA-binding MarR family transcriptional regulator